MKILNTIFALVLVLAWSGCNAGPLNPLTKEKLDKIEDGMSATQVKTILGIPNETKDEPIPIVGGTKSTYIYTHDNDRAVIILKNGTVQSKEGHFSKDK
ncbi:MAG: outer membrane protein assembly factor BamE [Chthoniobacterales bacterium]